MALLRSYRTSADWKAADLLSELSSGHRAADSMFTNKRQGRNKIQQAATFKQKELFVDMLIHIMVRARYYGHCPLEWCWKISSILKDGNLSDIALNSLNIIHLSYSVTMSREISSETIPAFYEERMKLMIDEIVIQPSTGKSYKKYSWILMVDNYACTKYAAEQTGKKAFTSTIDSLSILAIATENDAFVPELTQSEET